MNTTPSPGPSRLDAWLPSLRPLSAEARLLAHALRTGLWRSLAGNGHGGGHGQRILTWRTGVPGHLGHAAVVAFLRARGLCVQEGGNTFYLPPQPGLAAVLGPAVGGYPPDSGFKILRDFRDLDEAHYLRPDRQTRLRRRLIGSPRDQLIAANYLHHLALGPRVWDVCVLRAGHVSLPAFVVQHVAGTTPTPVEWAVFVDRLATAVARTELRITVPRWRRHKDFRCPDCNRNLLRDDAGRLHYIDFQNFSLRDRRRLLWSVAARSTDRALRGHRRRGAPVQGNGAIHRALADHGIGLEGRLVLEVGCGTAARLHDALAAGAWWALGWDRPEVTDRARALAAALGFTRLHVAGRPPGAAGDLREATPAWLHPYLPEAVVLVTDERQLPPGGLDDAPWRALVAAPRTDGTPVVRIRESTSSAVAPVR